MDTFSQETLAEILKMDKANLTEDQLAFVMARRSYLNDADQARFAEEIKLHEAGKLFGGSANLDEVADEDLEDLKVADLKKIADKLEIEGSKDMKKPELIEAIKEARA